MTYCQKDPAEHISVKFESKYKIKFSQETTFQSVVHKMSAILFGPRFFISFHFLIINSFGTELSQNIPL